MSNSQKNTFSWTRDITKDLISLYEAQPVLYITKLKDYKNKTKRMEAVMSIKKELCAKYPLQCASVLTDDDVQKKIHGIRTQYMKEVNLLKKFLSSGASADAYIPKLWCFDLLSFLREGDPIRQGESNLESPKETIATEELSQVEDLNASCEVVFDGTLEELHDTNLETRSSTPLPSTSSKKKRVSSPAIATLINSAVKSLEEHRKKQKLEIDEKKQEDEYDTFGKTVAMELRKIKDPVQVINLKKSIFIQLMDAQSHETTYLDFGT